MLAWCISLINAFITNYFPLATIISLRTQIMNFKQLEHEHVAQSWEMMKLMLRNYPTHGLNLWMIIHFFAGMNFVSRNLLDSAAGGTFMEITLGESTKLLDNIMANYSQWHTERAPNSQKVNSVEEISSLSEKVDALMKMLASKSAPIDFNDIPLSTLIEQNSDAVDVNFISRNNFNNNDFISTPVAPPATSAVSCDINAALLNLVMKDQFSGTPNKDSASHINTFVELCDMQK